MFKIRFRYRKTGNARYISHLDLLATMQRALLRAGIKLKYSEGFNPHPYMSVALPLPVGSESLCELMDVGIIDSVLPAVESIVLPDGITLLEAYIPARKFDEITWIEINNTMYYNKGVTDDFTNRVKMRFAEESIVISKRTKRGYKNADIAPFIKNVEIRNGDCISLTAKISARNPTINAADIEGALGDALKPDYMIMKRIDIYDTNMLTYK